MDRLADEVRALSPYTGKSREMHQWLADRCTQDGLITVPTKDLGEAVGVRAPNATIWLWKAVSEGHLEVVIDRRHRRLPSTFRVVNPRKAMAL